MCLIQYPIEELTWEDVRHEVQKLNPIFSAIIDRLSPGKKYKLIKARYFNGDLIIDNGVLTPFSQTTGGLQKKCLEKLKYSPIPLFLTLKKAHEVFVQTDTRVIPLNTFQAGSLLGLFESIDAMFGKISSPRWSVSAGARSIFMLPNVNESIGFSRLRMEYDLPASMELKQLSNHWHVFKEISQHANFHQKWQSEVLFFTDDWILNHDKDPAWLEFRNYLFEMGWEQAKFATDKINFSLAWESFAQTISSKRIKPTPYLADQVKHIVNIAAGKWPAFKPAEDNEIAPIDGLQQAFVDIYKLKNYLPTIMYADLLGLKKHLPVYYSLYFPTLLEGSAQNFSVSTIMLDLHDIKTLLDIFKQNLLNNKKFDYNVLDNINFEYFHVDQDKFNKFKSSKLLEVEDSRFLKDLKKFPDKIFCTTSSFWRGCLKISVK